MAARVPVLGQHHVRELSAKPVDERHHLVAARHRQGAAGTKSFWISTTSSTSCRRVRTGWALGILVRTN